MNKHVKKLSGVIGNLFPNYTNFKTLKTIQGHLCVIYTYMYINMIVLCYYPEEGLVGVEHCKKNIHFFLL